MKWTLLLAIAALLTLSACSQNEMLIMDQAQKDAKQQQEISVN